MGRAFEFRKERKMKRWSNMARVFTKIGREIAIAVKSSGPDPDTNPKLRLAIQNAKAANMPKKNVEAAIQRATSKDAENLEEVIYEGYGPHGIAFVVECLTDNPTRTVANIRMYFSRSNGSMGTSGSVGFMFDRRGEFIFPLGDWDIEELELELLEGNADEIDVTDDGDVYVYTAYEDFGLMQKTLEDLKIEVKEASLQRLPTAAKKIDDPEQREAIEKLAEKFEDDDDVQKVFHSMV